jgi:structural maintenance of chromosome 4
VSVVANYIKARTKNAQFIIISLRNNMFELADKLIGVYKTHDQTKTISITPELVMKKIRENEQKENQGIN